MGKNGHILNDERKDYTWLIAVTNKSMLDRHPQVPWGTCTHTHSCQEKILEGVLGQRVYVSALLLSVARLLSKVLVNTNLDPAMNQNWSPLIRH